MAERKPLVLVGTSIQELPAGDTLPATPPNGGAGGVLSGSYPNPGFAVDMATQGELDAHTANTANPHGVTKAQVGLGNVDNTADSAKPVSTAQQTALNAKQATLVSGSNIKTVGGQSLLGSGDITLGTSIAPMVLSANTALAPADAGKLIDCTGSMTLISLPLASAAGNGWFVIVRNKRILPTGLVTVLPSGSNTIDTMVTMDVLPGLSYMILCNGTGYVTTKMGGQGYLYVTSGTSWTCPAGVHQAKITVIGGGGGGGGGKSSGSNGSGGGQGGVGSIFVPLTPGTVYMIVIGTGGTGGTGGGGPTDGMVGGNTTFTYSGSGTATSYGGGPGAKGEASLTTVIWGGGAGSPGSLGNAISVGIPAASGGFAYGVSFSSGAYSPGFIVNGSSTGRGGSGGFPGNTGTVGSPGAIIIEY